eukprot:99000-Rhodomonas_salina.1
MYDRFGLVTSCQFKLSPERTRVQQYNRLTSDVLPTPRLTHNFEEWFQFRIGTRDVCMWEWEQESLPWHL